MTIFQLSSGREIYLSQLSITLTYRGVIEGSPETASTHIREGLPRIVNKIMPGHAPLLVLPSLDHPLPPYLWIAAFDSHDGVAHTDPDYSSELTICWFSDHTAFELPLNAFIGTMIADIDWDHHAQDYDIMDF